MLTQPVVAGTRDLVELQLGSVGGGGRMKHKIRLGLASWDLA